MTQQKLTKKDIKQEEESGLKRKASQETEELKSSIGVKNVSKVIVKGESDLHTVNKWWEKEESQDEQKWNYLEHHGVLFPALYTKHQVRPLYEGKPVDLTAQQEEMASYWAQTIGTDWETKPQYIQNFSKMFLDTFQDNRVFSKFDFTPIKDFQQDQKNRNKDKTADDKKVTL